MPTVAVEFSSKALQLDHGRKVRVQTWDTAGQETYRAITMKYASSHAVITEKRMAQSSSLMSHGVPHLNMWATGCRT